MATIHIETTILSETLHLPQLIPLVGKHVEITVREKVTPLATPATSDRAAVEAAVLGLENYDSNAYCAARELEVRQASQVGP
jgi:hypothetical protein